MPEWMKEIILTILGSSAIAGGIGWWFKSRREDKKEERLREEARYAALEAKCEGLQVKLENLLMDAIAREKESNEALVARTEMDRELMRFIFSGSTALKANAALLAKLETRLGTTKEETP